MTAMDQRLTNRVANRSLDPHQSDQWLGGEAHVRIQRGRTWRDLFYISHNGMVGLAFLVGIALGTGVTILARRRP